MSKVRAGGSISAQEPIPSTSAEDKLLRINQTDTTHVSGFQGDACQAAQDSELQQLEDLQGQGVLYCELNPDNGFLVKTDDAVVEQNMVDPSAPYITKEP